MLLRRSAAAAASVAASGGASLSFMGSSAFSSSSPSVARYLRRAVDKSRVMSAYSAASKAWPLSLAFATCWLKGSASDAVTQKVVEQKPSIDWRRNFAFATFSGAYLGCGQHFVYNVLFTRWFGSGQCAMTAAKKCFADATVHVPLFYLPLYYAFEDTVLRDGPLAGLRRYSGEWFDCMKPYWMIFSGFHFINFQFTPPELRILTIAGVSFIWLIVLSYVSHQAYEQEKLREENTEEALQSGAPVVALAANC